MFKTVDIKISSNDIMDNFDSNDIFQKLPMYMYLD